MSSLRIGDLPGFKANRWNKGPVSKDLRELARAVYFAMSVSAAQDILAMADEVEKLEWYRRNPKG